MLRASTMTKSYEKVLAKKIEEVLYLHYISRTHAHTCPHMHALDGEARDDARLNRDQVLRECASKEDRRGALTSLYLHTRAHIHIVRPIKWRFVTVERGLTKCPIFYNTEQILHTIGGTDICYNPFCVSLI